MAARTEAVTNVEVRRVKAEWVRVGETGLQMFAQCPVAHFDEDHGFKLNEDEHLLIVARSRAGHEQWVDYFLIDGDIQNAATEERRRWIIIRGIEVRRLFPYILRQVDKGDKLLEFAAYVKAKAWLELNVN